MKKLTCVVCPNGCELEVTIDNNMEITIEGAECQSGYNWAEQETTNPMRTFATSIAVENGDWPLVSVRTDKPVPLTLIKKAMDIIREKYIQAPVKAGDIIIKNIAGTNASIIATRNVFKRKE